MPLKIIVQLSVSTGTTVEIYSFVFFFSEIGGWAFTWYITLYTILVQKWGVGAYMVMGAYKVLYSTAAAAAAAAAATTTTTTATAAAATST